MRVLARLRLPLRLTLVFAAVMSVVLVATGAFLYAQLGSGLDSSIEAGLLPRAAGVTALARRESGGPAWHRQLVQVAGDGLAQIIDERGRVLDGSAPSGRRLALRPSELALALRGRAVFEHRVPGSDEPWRLVATPVDAGGRRLVAVAGASLEHRIDALFGLLVGLLIGMPLALLLASLAGYGVAAAALRPVESMRRRAEAISGSQAGERLPVPAAADEIRRLGETLNGMLARLEAALARERSFVADASHELRTPLSLLRTELELALRRPRTAEELESAIRSAAEETDRLSQLAEDLLVLARSDQGALPLRTATLQVREVLDGVSERFAHRSADSGRSISVDSPAELELEGDRTRLEQALGNLVDNALRHGRGEVRLLGAEDDGRVTLHVTDVGPGFPPDFLGRAFERFARPDGGRSGGGTGLGLAIVDVIARAHSGSAHAANRAGAGADVWLSLPKRPT
jgi:heavy metal sensor kinase